MREERHNWKKKKKKERALSSKETWSFPVPYGLTLGGVGERVCSLSEPSPESYRLGRPVCSSDPGSHRLSASIQGNSPVWVFSAFSAFRNWGYHCGWLVVPWGVVQEGCVERRRVGGRQLCECATGHCAALRRTCCFSHKQQICSVSAGREKLICARALMQDKQSHTFDPLRWATARAR